MEIQQGEIHLWQLKQADFDLAELRSACVSWLTESELPRYHRYQFDRHRKQFLLGRVLMRSALSNYDTRLAPDAWQFVQNQYGKPAIIEAQNSKSLYFNLSHSADRLVLAVANFSDIGVDIEHAIKSRKVAAIAARYFSQQEAAEILTLSGDFQRQRFYDLWTLKEAYIKACGMGLAIPLQEFSYQFGTDNKLAIEFAAERQDQESAWRFWQIDVGSEYKLALAARTGSEGREHQLRSWKLTALHQLSETKTKILRSN